jgi:hypothetical protein
MWDYNIGLVRITPFFKSCKYSKVCCSCLDTGPATDASLDNASESLERQPGSEKYQLQHHRRRTSCSR